MRSPQHQHPELRDPRFARVWRASAAWLGLALLSPAAGATETEAASPAREKDRVHAVDAIVVTGSRTERPLSEAPVATEVITEEEIAESGAQNLSELLEEHPGVYLDRSFAGAGPQLQGLPADYTLVLVDGVRQPGRINGVLDLDRFSIEEIERVEIVRGSASALYGSDAMGGVINIITREAKKPLELSALGSVGAYRTIDASLGAGMTRAVWSARLSGGYHTSDGFDLDPSDVATTQAQAEQHNAAMQASLSPSRELTLTATADYRRRERQAIDLSPAGGAVFDRDNLTETTSVLLKPEWKVAEGTRLEVRASLSLFRDQFLLDQRGANDLDELSDTRERLAQLGAQIDTLLGGSHLLSVGSEAWYEKLSTERLLSGSGERTRAALYVQDEWTLLDGPLLVLLPGARVDIDSQFGVYATPRAALRVDPLDELTLRASYGWGFKAPDFRELYLLFENPSAGYLVEGNTALQPETSESVNLGAELRPHRSVWLSAQAFWNELRDRIGTDLVPADDVGPRRFRYRNIDSASSRGVEANVRLSPLSGLRLDMGYAWTQTRDGAGGQPFSGQPLHRATASARYRVPGLGFEALGRGAFVGKRPFYQDTNGDEVAERQDASGYASVDLRLAQAVGYGVTTFLLAENLLDAGDADFLPMQPRTFSGGMRLDY